MSEPSVLWQVQAAPILPDWIVPTLRDYLAVDSAHASIHQGRFAAQLLWQRGIRDPEQLIRFLNPNLYQPTHPFAFGEEMGWAVERLLQAREDKAPIAIWGDFDADGVTATAVLWEGLGQFFPPPEQLTYYIPNRFTESHGLSQAGIDRLAAQGYRLIVTCDTGSTNLTEIAYARSLGIDLIITDHHTLPTERPPVTAILNPRTFPPDHPLAHLSGVAVAYKLVEALYQRLPQVPHQPLEFLLDLVAIGLIADLVQLTGDCRYLAQRGIERLQQQSNPATATRPGVARLLELCKRNGDRPTDIAYGLGPRINAVSRIQGDAHFCVELLTSKDPQRCKELAENTELANTRRKALQKELLYQVRQRIAQLDLTTTQAIVLMDPQWPPGILGLVAGQLAQEYGRPVILLIVDPEDPTVLPPEQPRFARGSARSVPAIDLYQLFQDQAHLLQRFGGHPLAAGLSLPVENVPLFTAAINQKLRQQGFAPGAAQPLAADVSVTVADLGRDLFRELKLIEPCGMGNPVPRLLIQNCWFTNVQNRNIQDWQGRKIRYIKTEFSLWDDSCRQGFPGVWWEHYRDDIPAGRCDAIVELDYNAFKQRYEVRLIALRSSQQAVQVHTEITDWILDWRGKEGARLGDRTAGVLVMPHCPTTWTELQVWLRRARQEHKPLALAYPPPATEPPAVIWQRLVGLAKYLSRTGKTVTRTQLREKLGIGDRTLQLGFQLLGELGCQVQAIPSGFHLTWNLSDASLTLKSSFPRHLESLLNGIQEDQFRQQYFYTVSFSLIQKIAGDLLLPLKDGTGETPHSQPDAE